MHSENETPADNETSWCSRAYQACFPKTKDGQYWGQCCCGETKHTFDEKIAGSWDSCLKGFAGNIATYHTWMKPVEAMIKSFFHALFMLDIVTDIAFLVTASWYSDALLGLSIACLCL